MSDITEGNLLQDGVGHVKKGMFDKAIECWAKIPVGDKDYYDAQLNLGTAYAEKGESDNAIEYWKNIPENHENYIDIQLNLGTAYAEKGESDNAIECWKNIPENHEKYNNSQLNLGSAYFEKGNLDKAIECWKNIPINHEKYNSSQLNLGTVYAQKRGFDTAIEYLEKIPKNDENYYKAQLNLGIIYDKRGILDKAIECFENIPVGNNCYNGAQLSLGNIYSKKGEFDTEIECFENIPVGDNYYCSAQVNLGIAYAFKGNNVKSADYFKKYTDIILEQGILEFHDLIFMHTLNQEYKFYEDDKFLEYKKKIILQEQKNNKNTLKTFINEDEPLYNNIRATPEGKKQYILYQYMRCSKETLYRIKNNYLAFTNPRGFNDPYDPLIKVVEKTEDKKDALLEKLDFKIACLSKNPKNILMWSHYADKHTGVCVAYDVTELIDDTDIVFKKIDFRKDIQRPKGDCMLNIENVTPTTILDTFTTKHIDWEYEKEYRFIKISDGKKQVVSIVKIYLGKDISPENEELIKHIVDNKVIEKNKEKNKEKIVISKLDFGSDNVFELEEEK